MSVRKKSLIVLMITTAGFNIFGCSAKERHNKEITYNDVNIEEICEEKGGVIERSKRLGFLSSNDDFEYIVDILDCKIGNGYLRQVTFNAYCLNPNSKNDWINTYQETTSIFEPLNLFDGLPSNDIGNINVKKHVIFCDKLLKKF